MKKNSNYSNSKRENNIQFLLAKSLDQAILVARILFQPRIYPQTIFVERPQVIV
ncbi:hypothetical protein SAMN05216283_10334 [Sunxiuqinia elliptica]|uniref:Uncharacterized protein n=1 Tax=Sunxiuqinia elliptica TaxID=655355 RepID=A0A1I2GMG3_9BACT|nr:hypothetical protein SAMN05216283_10334 [Sunxiuqinia elliptica]